MPGRHRRLPTLLAGVLLAVAPPASAGVKLVAWRAADGLPQSLTVHVTVAPDGRVLATHGPGLAASVLDGFSVRTLTNAPGAAGRLHAAADGRLWTLTTAGVAVAGPAEGWRVLPAPGLIPAGTFRPLRPPPLLPLAGGRALVVLPETLALADAAAGTVTAVAEAAALGLGRFQDLTLHEATGEGFVTAAAGAFRLQVTAGAPPRLEPVPPPAALQLANFQRPFLLPAGGGFLTWAEDAAGRRRLVRWQDGAWSATPLPEGVRAVWPGPEGVLWGHDGGSLLRFTEAAPERAERITPEAGRIMDFALAPDGACWAATTEGLVRAAPRLWRRPAAAPEDDAPVTHLAFEPGGRPVLLTPDALRWGAPDGWRTLPRGEPAETGPLGPEPAFPLAPGRWLVRRAAPGAPAPAWAVADLDAARWEAPPPALHGWEPLGRGAEASSLLLGRTEAEGALAVAVWSGGALSAPEPVPAAPARPPTLGFLTRRGEPWLGWEDLVLGRRGTNWLRFEDAPSGARDGAFAALEFPDGRLWIGGRDGVREFDGERWRIVRRGLDRVHALRLGADGTPWAATAGGVHHVRNGAWMTHGPDEGLPAAAVYALAADAADRVWAGTARGPAVLRPEADRDPPRVEAGGAELGGPAGAARGLFSFGGEDRWRFTAPGRLLFSWRLDNGPWSPWRGASTVQITNLPAGDHRFEVRGMDRAGNVAAEAAVTAFSIARPWFRDPRLLAVSGLGLLAILASAGLAVNRHRRLRRSYAEVGRIVEQRTRELERANAELLHSQKMRALGTLAAGVAHDFNGLLSIIKGSAQLLERAVPATDERARQRLARIQGAVEQGTGLVRAMLGYGRAGPRTGEAFDLPPALAEARGLLAESFGPRVRWEVPDALPAVFGSAEMLRQMLLNLVQNADEAMDARGETLVRVRRLEAVPAGGVLAPAAAGPCLALEVTDHGVGIPPEHLSRLFEPFFTTKGFSARRGTGLGLLMVHEFAKELGYGLQVESTVGAGSTFRILLPLAAPARPAGPG